jgi:hypothetical protein
VSTTSGRELPRRPADVTRSARSVFTSGALAQNSSVEMYL